VRVQGQERVQVQGQELSPPESLREQVRVQELESVQV
jgi:hypothetical protein